VQTINIPDLCTLLALSDNYITVGMGSVFIHIEIEDYSIQPMPLKVLDGMHRPPTDVIVLNDEFILTCHRKSGSRLWLCAGAQCSRVPHLRRCVVCACTDVTVFVDRNGIMSRDYIVRWTGAPIAVGTFVNHFPPRAAECRVLSHTLTSFTAR